VAAPASARRVNGAGTFLYATENSTDVSDASRYLASLTSTYTPAEWVTFDGLLSYDYRSRVQNSYQVKGYRTDGVSAATNKR
jgi:hypothetical protein